jgi:hypothetical protein
MKRRERLGIRTRICPVRLTPNVSTRVCIISHTGSVAPQVSL